MSRMDIQRVVTDRIIMALEKGGLQAWRKPWQSLGVRDKALPYNYSTHQPYRGINTWSLLFEALDQGYTSNGWLTFKQAQALGASVRKGEKGTLVVKYLVAEVSGKNAQQVDRADDHDVRLIPFLRHFYLFNLDQIDGLDRPAVTPKPIPSDADQVAAIEQLVSLQADTGLTYRRRGDRACYYPATDSIAMPAGEFETGTHFAATLAHELVHATGHQRRLGRFAVTAAKYPNAEEAYAVEELVAELGAAMICAEHGIVGEHLQHESYIHSWLGALKQDKTLIFKVARQAAEAHDFLMGALPQDNVMDNAA